MDFKRALVMVLAIAVTAVLVSATRVALAQTTLWSDDFDDGDMSDWTAVNPVSGSDPSLMEVSTEQPVSSPYSLKVSGPGSNAKGPTVRVDLGRPYTIRFSFRYSNLHRYVMATFGPVNLLVDQPWMELKYRDSSGWHSVGTQDFDDYCPANTWSDFRIEVDPSTGSYDVYVNEVLEGTASYGTYDSGHRGFRVNQRTGPGGTLGNAYYDNFSIEGTTDSDLDEWPMFQRTPDHAGQTPDEGPGAAGLVHDVIVGNRDNTVESSPVVHGAFIYAVNSQSSTLDVFQLSDWSPAWSVSTGGQAQMSPAVGYGRVYVGNNDGDMMAFDLATHGPVWSNDSAPFAMSSPTLANNEVFYGHDSRLYACNAATGDTVWSFETGDYYGTDATGYLYRDPNSGGAVWSSPAYSEGIVVIGCEDGKVYAVEDVVPTTLAGNLLWTYDIGEGSPTSPIKGSAALVDDVVYIASGGERLWALELYPTPDGLDNDGNGVTDDEGDPLWSYNTGTGEQIQSTPAVSGGYVVFTTPGGTIYCLDTAGNLVWSDSPTASFGSNSPIIAGSKVYVGSADPAQKTFYCYSLAGAGGGNPDLLWSRTSADEYTNSATSADQVVYAMTTQGAVHAFHTPLGCSANPANLAFGTVLVGDHVDMMFTITNTDGGWLTGSVSETCDGYTIISGGGDYVLGPGQSRDVMVRFEPMAGQSYPCTIETGDALCSDVTCSGQGDLPPACDVDPASIGFGAVLPGGQVDRTFTIENTGGGVLSGNVSETCNHYSIVAGGGGYALTGGQTQNVTVRFQPTSTGTHLCTIETGQALCSDASCTGQGVSSVAYLVAHHHLQQFDSWIIDETDGTLNYENTHQLTHAGDPSGIGMYAEFDGDSLIKGYLFISAEFDQGLEIVDAIKNRTVGWSGTASGLGGVAVDSPARIVYAVDSGTDDLYAYDFDPVAETLSLRAGFPRNLPNCTSAWGIALDTVDSRLWVACPTSNRIRAYDTVTWLEDTARTFAPTLPPNDMPIGIGIDEARRLIYSVSISSTFTSAPPGAGSDYISKFDLISRTETTHYVGHDCGDIDVEEDKGYIYVTGGVNGDNVTVLDPGTTPFTLIDEHALQAPGGISVGPWARAVPHVGKDDGLEPGECAPKIVPLTYDLPYDNLGVVSTTNTTIVDYLPSGTTFLSATGGGAYDGPTHTVTWDIGTLPSGATGGSVQVDVQITASLGSVLYNRACIDSDETDESCSGEFTAVCDTFCSDRSDGTSCEDNNECTDPDECLAGRCVGSPVLNGTPCDDGNVCTDPDQCLAGSCLSTVLPDGTPCTDDNNVCTDDECQAGSCEHTPVSCDDFVDCTTDWCVPSHGCINSHFEVIDLAWSDRTTIFWSAPGPGASYDVAKGDLAELPVGGGPSEYCLAPGITTLTTTESANPAHGKAFWYLVRGRSASCGIGTYGYEFDNGSPTQERLTAACP